MAGEREVSGVPLILALLIGLAFWFLLGNPRSGR